MGDFTRSAAQRSAPEAFGRAGVTPSDIDTLQFYDSFTITVLMLLEDSGFCAKGEGGAFVAEGHLKRGGRFPMNTDGGGLSSSHSGMRGIFLLIEAVRQLRGQAGEAQVPDCELALLCGLGRLPLLHRQRHPGEGLSAWKFVRRERMAQAAARSRCHRAAVLRRRRPRGELKFQQCPACAPPAVLSARIMHAVRRRRRSGPVPRDAAASTPSRFCGSTTRRTSSDELPYVVAMIELEEGVQMFGTLTDCDPASVKIGMPVEAYAVEVEEGVAIPFWRPA